MGCGSCRQSWHTGTREIVLSWSPQTRHSSRKIIEKRPRKSVPAARSTASGTKGQRMALGSRLLEKTHLQLNTFSVQQVCAGGMTTLYERTNPALVSVGSACP